MSTIESDQPEPFVSPRPGVVKTLGVCNIVFSVLSGLCMLSSAFWLVAMMNQPAPRMNVPVTATATTPTRTITFNPFMGMSDPVFIRFSMVDAGTSILLSGIMFATGIGLINLKRWGARWWTTIAWIKIVRLFLLWGYYILVVAPVFSESMARSVIQMFEQSGLPKGRVPPAADLIRTYSIMNLIMAISIIVFCSLYPAISLWLIGQPRVQAALIDKPVTEPEFP